jgi:WD40 repeat protein
MLLCPPDEKLTALLADALSTAERDALARHVEECAACQDRLVGLTGTPDAAARGRAGHAPPGSEAEEKMLGRLKRMPSWLAPTVHTPGARRAGRLPTLGSLDAELPSVPGYEILGELGRGGMGIVYQARQLGLQRIVAIKMILAGNQVGPKNLSRFRAEAAALARLQHPNIVQIYDVGETAGRPYFVLEYVAGGSLAQYLQGMPVPVREAAQLVEILARAVHAAHANGVIHRDLKPANILLAVGSEQGAVDSEERDLRTAHYLLTTVPKITDFGVAKYAGDDREAPDPYGPTVTGEILGTPSYMAPEQAMARRQPVGPATDVYALGAILYELLTGRPPFAGETPLATVLQVLHDEPVSVASLRPKVPPDLETICEKCLRKEPGRRYASAEALADDLRRFQAGDPITARRPGLGERLGRWFRRNTALAVASVLGIVTLVAVAGLAVNHVFTLQLRQEQDLTKKALQDAEIERARAEKNADEAERFHRQAERLSVSLALERGLALLDQGDVAHGMLLLGRSLQLTPAGDAAVQRIICTNLAAAHHQLPFRLRSVLGHKGEVQAVAFSPDGNTLVTGSRASAPQRWNPATGETIGDPLPHPGEIRAVAFSSDGTLLATAGTDKTARVWEAATGKPVGKPLTHAHWVQTVAFSPDGKTVLTGSADGTARLWDAATGDPRSEPLLPPGWVHAVAFSPDGKFFATAGSANSAQFWQAATAMPIGTQMDHLGEVWAVAFSPDGRVLMTGSDEGARFWEAGTGRPLGLALLNQGAVRDVGYSPDGKILWTAGASGKVRLWDAVTLSPVGAPVQHQTAVYAVALNRDQNLLATGSADGKVRLWEKPTPRPPGLLLAHPRLVYCVAISPDGKTIATGAADPTVRLWDAATGNPVGKALTHQASVLRVVFSRDGRTLLTACTDKTARLWDVAEGTPREPVLAHADHVYAVAFSPDGKTVLTGCKDSTARLWDAATGAPRGEPLRHPNWVHAVAFSPDGKTILTGCEDATARLWDAATGKPLGEPLPHRGPVRAVAFSPDGGTLLTGTWDDGKARLWDTATRKPLGPPLPHQDHVLAVAFSPDGKTIATGAWDGTVRLWDTATGKPLGPALVHQRSVRDVAFAPDGKTLLTASFDRTARTWEVPVAVEGNVNRIVLWIQVLTGTELDADGLFRDLDAATWQQRRRQLADLGGPPVP